VGDWLWEYCVPKKNPDASSTSQRVLFSVLRCSARQVPDGVAAAETCKCIPNAYRPSGANSCECNTGINGQPTQFQPLLISSVASTGFTNLITGYRIPGVASSGFGGVGADDQITGTNKDNTGFIIPAGLEPRLTLTSNNTGAKTSFASGLPYNYTVGSGLDLVYGSDNKGSLSQTGGILANTSATNASTGGIGMEIIPAFIGGSCYDIAPSCNGYWNGTRLVGRDLTRCLTSATCTDMTMSSANQPVGGRAYWDPKRSACIDDPDAPVDEDGCTDGFGANNTSRICRDTQGKCEIGGALDQCKTYSACKDVNGFWDTWLLRNKCREKRSDCISGSAGNFTTGAAGSGSGTNSKPHTDSGDDNTCDKPHS